MTGTGFIKCIPITLSDLCVELASSVIEIEEVLLAIMASGLSILSRLPNTAFFTFAFSTIAYHQKLSTYTTKSVFLSLKVYIYEANLILELKPYNY